MHVDRFDELSWLRGAKDGLTVQFCSTSCIRAVLAVLTLGSESEMREPHLATSWPRLGVT